jgi:uncharacterized protein (TIGR03435 family)
MSDRYVVALSTFLSLAAWIVTLAAPSSGQTQASATFEAATLRETPPHDPSGIGYFRTYAGGRMMIRGCTLRDLIWHAYKVQAFQVLNAPAWALQTFYSIEAVPPRIPTLASYHPTDPKSAPPDEELVMLQNFLSERFHLKVHEEMKEGPAYALLRADRLLRLNEPADNTVRPLVTFNTPDVPGGSFFRQGFNVSMADLAAVLSRDLKNARGRSDGNPRILRLQI